MKALHCEGIRPALLVGCLFLVAVAVSGCSTQSRTPFRFDSNAFLGYLDPRTSPLQSALYLTVSISVIAQIIGVILGIFAALGKMARLWPLRLIANLYIWVFRGTPLLVQLVFFFYGFGAAHVFDWPDNMFFGLPVKSQIEAAIVILGVNEGAYMAEIVRAGIMAVDPGQTEAAKSLGMTYRLTMTRIVLPQAARVIIPPLGNEFNNMLKTTSLISVLGVIETYNYFVTQQGLKFNPFEAYAACAIWFLMMTTIWGVVQGRIERRFAKGTTGSGDGQKGPGFASRLVGLKAQVEA
jgi:polar amino acid transport system permease protein